MSGGVDSSVAAALCVEAGYRVIGIMLRLWADDGGQLAANRCCSPDAVADAAAVADTLEIPFTVVDARDLFKREVVDRFVAGSAAGDTPNPCLSCNRFVRFGFLLEQALALGADALATGHYVRLARGEGPAQEFGSAGGDGVAGGARVDGGARAAGGTGPAEEAGQAGAEGGTSGTWRLLRGVDRAKDQSYVLSRLDQSQLARAIFPVGGMEKAEVRQAAERFALRVSGRADSVDLCWVGGDGVRGFLSRHLPDGVCSPGPILDRNGRVVGEHMGLPLYTLGQRRGLGVSLGSPVHVIARDVDRNALVVGPADDLDATDVQVRDMHWIAGRAPDGPVRVTAQVRYRAPAAPATIVPGPGRTAAATFDEPQRAPTPGQALVVYDRDECLGGGVIVGRAAD